MAKQKPLSGQLRKAILYSEKTRYRIAQETGVTEGQLLRFVHGKAKLMMDSIDKIGECLELEITVRTTRKRKDK